MDREFWDGAYKDDPDHVDVVDHFLIGEVDNLVPGSALDLGCGAGWNALKLAELGWSVTGVDWSERAIELARQSANERGLDVTFSIGDITMWKPPTEFDLVINTYALPSGEMSRRALQTAVTALSRGGTLIVAEWDQSMSEVWGISEEELTTPEQIVSVLGDLQIEKAEVRDIEEAFPSPDDPRRQSGSAANVAFVRARKQT